MGHPSMSNLFASLVYDLRYAVRQLRKSPGFTVLAVLLLAIGIGINAAMFTVVDTVLLRPLPFPHPSRIVALSETDGKKDTQGALSVSSLPDLMDWRAQAHAFQDIGWYRESPLNLQKPDGSTEFAVDMQTSANFFSMLQVRPFLGRDFFPYEDQAGKSDVVILSYFLWNSAFHADKAVLGKQVEFGKRMYTVIGVMPKGLYFPENNDGPFAWSPLPPGPSAFTDRNSRFLNGIGRLKPGTSIAAANAELNTIQANIAKRYASLHLSDRTRVVDYRSTLLGHVQPALFALEAAVLAVWLIACANLASLMLARANGRRHEIAIRSALGAGKSRLARQTMTEGLVLGLSGGALGLALAEGCLHLLRHSIGTVLPHSQDVHINWQVLLALLALSMLSALFFGLAPALQAATTQPQEALQDGTRSSGSGRHQSRLRNGLVIGQIALSLVLLVASGLLLRTLYALRNLPLGFQQHNLVVGSMFFPQDKYRSKDIGQVLYRPLLDRLRQVPGVESAGLVSGAPLSPEVQMQASFAIVGRPSPSKDFNQAAFRVGTRNIFHVLSIPLLKGRFFNETDTLGSPVVAVVNQSFARKYFPGEDPLGKRLDLNADNPTEKSVLGDVTIVGVAGDVPQGTPGNGTEPEIDFCYRQIPTTDSFYPVTILFMQLVVRTRQKPETLVPTLRNVVHGVDPDVTLFDMQTMHEKIDGLLGSQTLAARLLWMFSISALMIALAGIYGLLSYSVGQRTHEIGLRIALGAQRGDVLRLVLRQASVLLGLGIVLGVVCANLASSLLRSFLYSVGAHDVFTIAGVALLLAACGLLASYIPARRAASIDPMQALRSE